MCGEDFKFGGVFLINNIKKNRIDGDMAIHVYLELMVPPNDLSGAGNIDGSIKDHFAARDVMEEARGVVGELERVEASGEAEELAGARGLGAGLDLSGAEEGALVEDGHGRGGVVDWCDVWVGDVDCEKNLCV